MPFSYRVPFASIATLFAATTGRFEPPSSLSEKQKLSLCTIWLPQIFLARTILDACKDAPAPIVYVGSFRTWKEEVVAMQGAEDGE